MLLNLLKVSYSILDVGNFRLPDPTNSFLVQQTHPIHAMVISCFEPDNSAVN